jgi:hypothetical protein
LSNAQISLLYVYRTLLVSLLRSQQALADFLSSLMHETAGTLRAAQEYVIASV